MHQSIKSARGLQETLYHSIRARGRVADIDKHIFSICTSNDYDNDAVVVVDSDNQEYHEYQAVDYGDNDVVDYDDDVDEHACDEDVGDDCYNKKT